MSKLYFHGGRGKEKKKKKKSAVLEATLAQLKSSWVEFELGLGKADQQDNKAVRGYYRPYYILSYVMYWA